MRFNLVLERTSKRNFLPFSYQYEISSWIYKVIAGADKEFSKFLHGEAYATGKKRFKLFTFSGLDLRPFKIHKNYGRIEMEGSEASLQISFLIDQAAENFIKGLFLYQEFAIGDKIGCVDFRVSRIEACSPPLFTETMVYKTKSPVCITAKGEKHAQYLSPEDERYEKLLLGNLLEKVKAVSLAGYELEEVTSGNDFSFSLKSKPKSRLITIKAFTSEETQVRGYDFIFELQAPPAFQELGFYSGFGEKGSTGFGCVEVE